MTQKDSFISLHRERMRISEVLLWRPNIYWCNSICSRPLTLQQEAHGQSPCFLHSFQLRYSDILRVPYKLPLVTKSPLASWEKSQFCKQLGTGSIPKQQRTSGWFPVCEVQLHSTAKVSQELTSHRAIQTDRILVVSLGGYGKQNTQ